MKRLSVLCLFLLVFVKLNAQQNAKLLTAKVVYDAVYNQEKGMKIYPKFNVAQNANIDLFVNTCFYLENGKELKRFNNLYCCNSGKMSSVDDHSTPVKSSYDDTAFIFIPYSKLDLSKRKVHKIKFALMAFGQDQLPKSSGYYHSIINML